jgi:hypothetical protein
LLALALATIVEAARSAVGKLVVVNGIDEAAARYYEYRDFVRLPARADRLVQSLSTVAAALSLSWP